jgi:hypothetical protein
MLLLASLVSIYFGVEQMMVASIKMPGLQLTYLNSVVVKGDLSALFIQKRVQK